MNTYLLEIGVEELPAKQITRAVSELKKHIIQELNREKVPYGSIEIWSTPRRIAVYIDQIADKLTDEQLTVTGPSVSVAYDSNNEPSNALQGFLKKYNASASDITTTQKGKNEVVTLNTTIIGADSKSVIARLAPTWTTAATFNKSMRWRDYDLQFIRPIRWILSLWNSEHLQVAIESLNSDVYTYGHRTLANDKFKVASANTYLDTMQEAMVIIEPDKRREIILTQISAAENSLSVVVQKDETLLDEIINIVEYPTVFTGRFDDEFLSLPIPAVVMPMKDHQRYFPSFTTEGNLSTVFFGVRNGDDFFLDTVAKGNEKVLRARLKDAQFFFKEDRKKKLEDFVSGLKKVLYQAKLGTIYDKVTRIKMLSTYIAELVGLDSDALVLLHRAVELCKADLNTAMVNEFAELQGVMGKIYAQYDGEDELVAGAIASHYYPRFATDDIPSDMFGKIISVADKMDSLVGAYGTGTIPKGNKDPFGLRRMMISILSINLANDGFNPNLEHIINQSAELFADKFSEDKKEVLQLVKEGLLQRLRVIMNDKGYRYDIVEATIDNALCDISELIAKCDAIAAYDREKLENITINMLRAIKLSAAIEKVMPIDINLFENQAEQVMYDRASELTAQITSLADEKDYAIALDKLDILGNEISDFLENVMIMHDDERIRENRIQLLGICADAALRVADFGKLEFN